MSEFEIGLIGIGFMLLLVFLGTPVGIAMLLVGFIGFSHVVSMGAALSSLAQVTNEMSSNYGLTVIPLFMVMGALALKAGIGDRLFRAAHISFGNFPGGLAVATIAACAGFAAICGSSPATAATLGNVSIPEMLKYKYKPVLATGCVAAGGTLGILIPPSVGFIVYGIITEQSIIKLFSAGILPGILLAVLFIITIIIWCLFDKDLAPASGTKTTLREKAKALVTGLWETLALFILIMGGLFIGVFSPTEAAGVGACATLILGLIRKKLSWDAFWSSLEESLKTSAMIFLVIIGAMVFSRFLTVTQVPSSLSTWVESMHLTPLFTLICIVCVYMVLGCIIDVVGMVLITVPIFFPLMVNMGFDPIWFGVLVVLVCEMGLISPPVGMNVYVIYGITDFKIPLQTIFKGILPFFIAMLVCIAILTAFKEIALFLPGLLR
jgi:C4-dicarboxylate transporter, DctM subunit